VSAEISGLLAVTVTVLVALLVWVGSRHTARTQEAANKLEQSRAKLSASLLPKSRGGPALVVLNAGPATARDLVVRVDDRLLADHPCFWPDVPNLSTLGTTEVEFRLIDIDGLPDLLRVELRWTDDSGPGRRWSSDLILGP
jgi:hypothetical protein